MMGELVTFYSEGQRLLGNLHLPHPGAPCILMSHGLESSKDGNKWLALAPKFCVQGFACLRFTYRGCSWGGSEGRFEDTTLSGRIQDFKAALDYLITTLVDRDRIGVLGSSLGGVVPTAARDDRVKAMVLLATPSQPLSAAGEFVLPSGNKLKASFSSDMRRYNICQEIGKLRCPILIIHGDSDKLVPVDNAYKLYENAPEPKRLVIIEGGNHLFDNPEHLEEIAALSLEWFKRYLGGSDA